MFLNSVLLVLTVLLLFIGFMLLVLFNDWGSSVTRIKKSVLDRPKAFTVLMERVNLVYRVTEYTMELIQRTGLALYNAWIHFTLCIIAGITAFYWVLDKISFLPALSFGIVVVFVPFAVLKLMGDVMAERERKYGIDFLIILGNFLRRSDKHDIFEAFESAAPYVVKPIKTYLENMTFDYKHKINPVTCLERFEKNLSTPELRLYIENIRICYVRGGDIEGLTQAYIDEMALLDDDEDQQNAEDQLLQYGLYMLLFLNFAVVLWTLKGVYKQEILGNLVGQIIFIMDMAISMYIIYMTLKRN